VKQQTTTLSYNVSESSENSCCSSAGVENAVRPITKWYFILSDCNELTILVRGYATESNANPNRNRNTLVKSAMTGVLTGFAIAMVRGWNPSAEDVGQNCVKSDRIPDVQTSVKCDGAPVVNVIETHGKSWLPMNAIEADDPQVSLGCRSSC
jgi:hypothetical protein